VSNDSDDGGRGVVWEADSDLTATVGVALAEMARAQSRGVPVASHAAMVADALREAQRAVDDVVRRLRVVAGDARRAN
jgi:hypothetical protein